MCSNSVDNAQAINQVKIKGGCQSGKKVVHHDSKSDLPLGCLFYEYVVLFQVGDILSSLHNSHTHV